MHELAIENNLMIGFLLNRVHSNSQYKKKRKFFVKKKTIDHPIIFKQK